MNFIIPVNRLRETDTLIAFHHPEPSYPIHVLIIPKRGIKSLLEVEVSDSQFLTDVIKTTQSLVREFGIDKNGYRLILNGGDDQKVPLLHFHLISDSFSRIEP